MEDVFVKGYHVTSEATYFKALPPKLRASEENKILIGSYGKDGGCEFEFSVEIGGFQDTKPFIALKMYDDAFCAFNKMPEFFAMLKTLEQKPCSKKKFIETLNHIGFEDLTSK